MQLPLRPSDGTVQTLKYRVGTSKNTPKMPLFADVPDKTDKMIGSLAGYSPKSNTGGGYARATPGILIPVTWKVQSSTGSRLSNQQYVLLAHQ
jgi:hypothetical protein